MGSETKNTWGGKRANTGGKREGAGRKAIYAENDKPKQRGLAFSDNEWDFIKSLAEKENTNVKAFILSLCKNLNNG